MLGAIIGDIVGSPYEFDNHRSTRFPLFSEDSRFTDDTILTAATAVKLLDGGTYAGRYKEFYRLYPFASYGGSFRRWGESDSLAAYGSYGNGAAMRISPIGYAFPALEETLLEAERSASATHDHPEGIKGAQAVAGAIFLARTGGTKNDIEALVTGRFGYVLQKDLGYLRKHYTFNETCQQTVPEAISVFLASQDFEDALRKAVSIGGDSDTIACIVGGIAEPFYRTIPDDIAASGLALLDERLREIVNRFQRLFARKADSH